MIARYFEAGYVVQCGCSLPSALSYITSQLGMLSRYDSSSSAIEVEYVPGSWAESGYYWENNFLLKKA